MTLLYDAQQFTLYIGFFLLIVGVIGNGINIFIFSKVRNYRTTPCTFYFLVGSIDNIIYILLNLTLRILNVGFGIDVTGTSDIWCKIRQFLLVTPTIMSISFSCLAAIDQFLVTSRSANVRGYSKIENAHRIVIIVMIIWCLHGISLLFVYSISPISHTCTNTNAVFAIYSLVYLLGLASALPILIMMIFGWLTYRNIHRTLALAELNADRQLVRMTLIQVALISISLIPYSIYITYNLITSTNIKSVDQQIKEYFAYTILSMATYLYYVGPCYTFLISSNRFRRTVKDQLLWWRERNQIYPTNMTRTGLKPSVNNPVN